MTSKEYTIPTCYMKKFKAEFKKAHNEEIEPPSYEEEVETIIIERPDYKVKCKIISVTSQPPWLDLFSNEYDVYGENFDYERCDRSSLVVEVNEFLVMCQHLCRTRGYISRGKARDEDLESTADTAWLAIYPTPIYKEWAKEQRENVNDLDREEARNALEHARSMWQESNEWKTNHYLNSLNQAIEDIEYVSLETAGLVASVCQLYQRHLETEAKKRTVDSINEYIGEIGDRILLQVTITLVKIIEGDYGPRTLIKMATDEGHVITWWYSRVSYVKEGDVYLMKAQVKDHREFNGKKETVVTRAQLQEVKK